MHLLKTSNYYIDKLTLVKKTRVWERMSVIELLSRQDRRPKTVCTNLTSITISKIQEKFNFFFNQLKHNSRLISARDVGHILTTN